MKKILYTLILLSGFYSVSCKKSNDSFSVEPKITTLNNTTWNCNENNLSFFGIENLNNLYLDYQNDSIVEVKITLFSHGSLPIEQTTNFKYNYKNEILTFYRIENISNIPSEILLINTMLSSAIGGWNQKLNNQKRLIFEANFNFQNERAIIVKDRIFQV